MEDSLVMRRSRRSTAGNRMEAVLAEFKAEELGQDVEEDIDFIMGKGKSKSHYLLTFIHTIHTYTSISLER